MHFVVSTIFIQIIRFSQNSFDKTNIWHLTTRDKSRTYMYFSTIQAEVRTLPELCYTVLRWTNKSSLVLRPQRTRSCNYDWTVFPDITTLAIKSIKDIQAIYHHESHRVSQQYRACGCYWLISKLECYLFSTSWFEECKS